MQHLRTGIERLQVELQEQNARLRSQAASVGQGQKSLGVSKTAAKVLLRINTTYTKWKHIGGAELVFPMLHGHLCYQTHTCWNVWTKAVVWRALESWRRSISSIYVADPLAEDEQAKMIHADRGAARFLPKTWKVQSDQKVVTPGGTIYDSIESAQEDLWRNNNWRNTSNQTT